MTPEILGSLKELPPRIKGIVLDQWGVLHDGTTPYPHAIRAVAELATIGKRLGILSNSGKRAGVNIDRIAQMGFDPDAFVCVMTSGEALWQDFASKLLPYTRLYPITRAPADAEQWADGLNVEMVDLARSEAILLMGLPDDTAPEAFTASLEGALARGLPVLCSNPDLQSPRGGGKQATSPGALARLYERAGGRVVYYGKPHPAVFEAVQRDMALPPGELLMVGDSLAHDIKGAALAGWRSVFIKGGLHHALFGSEHQTTVAALNRLAQSEDSPLPDYIMQTLR